MFSFNPHTCWFVRCDWHSCVLCSATALPGTLFITLFRDSCRLVGQADLLHHTQSGWFFLYITSNQAYLLHHTHNQADLLHHTQSGWFISITHKDSFSRQCAVFQVSPTNGLSVNILILIECLLICFLLFCFTKGVGVWTKISGWNRTRLMVSKCVICQWAICAAMPYSARDGA